MPHTVRRYLVLFAALSLGLLLVYLRRPGSFAAPLVGVGDTEHLEWVPFLFNKALHFVPWPKLTLFQDLVLYPTGGTVTYLPFSWEANYVVAALTQAFGPGPWSYLYFLASHAFLFVAAFALLKQSFPPRLATALAFLVAFANAYAQAKFPRHSNMAFCHWTSLTLVYLSVLVDKMEHAQVSSAQRLLALAPLMVAGALGQDPGYLLPWCVTLWVTALVVILFPRASREVLLRTLNYRRLSGDALAKRTLWFSLMGAALLSFLYLPLNAQVAYDSLLNPPIEQGEKWANPLRWLLPAFPYLVNPAWDAFKEVMPEVGDAEMAGVPGWHLVIPALFGLFVLSPRRSLLARFWLALLALLTLSHPRWFPLLTLLPWHAMSRSSVRHTLLLAPLLVLLSSAFWRLPKRPSRLVLGALALLFVIEPLAQVLRLGGRIRAQSDVERAYFRLISESPGEAILEWPFCLTAWNQPVEGLCVAREKHYFTYNAQRFHGKKGISLDIGRASRRERGEWNRLLWNGLYDSIREDRCFSATEWNWILAQMKRLRLAGVEIYPELLPGHCLAEWERRLGKPRGRLKSPGTPERVFFRSLAD